MFNFWRSAPIAGWGDQAQMRESHHDHALTEPLQIRLHGRFRIETAAGFDLTPKSAKTQGLLALLVTSPNASRGRGWLQDKLWSDRGREQGAASLRQALSEIRRGLGPFVDVLQADRQSVGLDRTRIDLVESTDLGETAAEFLEGIDVRDGEFEAWLRAERSRRQPEGPIAFAGRGNAPHVRSEPQERPAVVFAGSAHEGSPLRLFEELFIDCVARSLGEAMSVDVFVNQAPPRTREAVRIGVQPFAAGNGRTGLRVAVHESGSNRLVWSGMRVIEDQNLIPDLDLDIMLLGNQMIDALSDALMMQIRGSREQRNANYLHRLAIRKIFSMRPEELVTADRLLGQAFEIDQRGVFLAWRAQLRAIQQVERHAGRSGTLREEAAEYSYLAMELEPSNSMVLAAVANSRLVFEEDVVACEELSKQSVAMNAANPLAWDSLSTAKLYAGDSEAAHRLALHAQRLGATAPQKFWWDMGLCMTAALTGRAELALKMAETSAALSPAFKPPLRYLTALYAYNDMPEKALKVAARLRSIEPEFSFDAIANDPKYPVSPLRKMGLLRADKLHALGT